jgi:hypothetical protein
LVARDFNWRGMVTFVREYVRGCRTCQHDKPHTHRPYGRLQPLPPADEPLRSWSVDAIVKLPVTPRNHDSIMVFVDRFSKAFILVPFREANFTEDRMMMMALTYVFCHWGIPDSIVSDRAKINTAFAWTNLLALLGVKPLLTTAHHSRGNGQVERINQVVETALRHYINTRQDDWDQWLPVIQYSYLVTPQTSTGLSPFKILYGIEPRTPLSRPRPQSKSPTAEARFDNMKMVHDEVREAIEIANARHSKFFNKSVQDAPPYKIGDWVMLDRRHLRRARPSLKLDQQYYGPFQIKAATKSPLVWELDLPPHLSLLHPKFHVVKLKPFNAGNKIQWQEPPRPVVQGKIRGEDDNALEYHVEGFHRSRIREGGSPNRQEDYEYLTSWTGYPHTYDLWQSYTSVRDVGVFKEFAAANIDNPDHVFPRSCRKYLGLPRPPSTLSRIRDRLRPGASTSAPKPANDGKPPPEGRITRARAKAGLTAISRLLHS